MRMPRAHPLHAGPPAATHPPWPQLSAPGDASQGCYSTRLPHPWGIFPGKRSSSSRLGCKINPRRVVEAPLALRKPWEGVFARGWLLSVWEVTPKPSSLPGCSLDSTEILLAVLAGQLQLCLMKMHLVSLQGCPRAAELGQGCCSLVLVIWEFLPPPGRSHSPMAGSCHAHAGMCRVRGGSEVLLGHTHQDIVSATPQQSGDSLQQNQENRRQGITHSSPCWDFVLNGSCQANLFIRATFAHNIPETQAEMKRSSHFLPQSFCLSHTCTFAICRAPFSLLPPDSGTAVLFRAEL